MLHLIPRLLRIVPSSWHRLLPALCSPHPSALIALRLVGSEIKDTEVPRGLHSINRKGAGFRRAQQKLWLQQTADCRSCTIALSACNTSPFPATLEGKWHFPAPPGCVRMQEAGEAHVPSLAWSGGGGGDGGGVGLYLPLCSFFSPEWQTENTIRPWPMCWTTWIFNEEWFPTALLHRSQS